MGRKENIVLKGITWGHSRGITPLLAASQRFSELHPHVTIEWHKRSLQAFADYPIEELTKTYDLLIIDHPWVGCAAATECVLPLEQYLSADFLSDQKKESVGKSHESYYYDGHQWALAIDAATPVASYRADLLQKNECPVPQTWSEVIALAKKGKVAVPAIPIDLLMNFYMFCLAHGREPFTTEEEVIDRETGIKALLTMQELYSNLAKEFFDCNPIAVAELMTSTDDYWYCPFAYGYSNYARTGYAATVLNYTDLVSFENSGRLRSTIGGTGLAVSAFSHHQETALAFAEQVVSPSWQTTLYTQSGGQPGYRRAWKDELNNRITNQYFKNVLPAMDRGYMRPRYNGYLHFQDGAGLPLQKFLREGGNPETVLTAMNEIYQESFINQTSEL